MRNGLKQLPRKRLSIRFAGVLTGVFMLAGCTLFSMINEDEQAAERKQQQAMEAQAAAQRRQAELAEQAARQREITERLTRLRAELQAERDVVNNALQFAKAVVDRYQPPSSAPPNEYAALAEESVSYLQKAMSITLTLDEHTALVTLPRTVAVDNAIVTTCARFRTLIRGEWLEPFMDTCLERAGGDAAKLSWSGIARDWESHRRIKAQRQAAEERARAAAEERARVAEAERARVEEENRKRHAEEIAARGTRTGTCYSDSECGGGACRNNLCTTAGGTCYSDSECPGGSCRSNRCTTAGGTCYSDSECGGGVCRSNQCTTAGGTCYSDSECGRGGVCRSNRCTTAGGTCYSDSECGGGVCRNNRCTTAGGTCYSDSECPGGTCRGNRCS